MGLKYSEDLIETLLRRVQRMKESVTYQAIVEEGVILSRREDLLIIGRWRFGPPEARIVEAIQGIEDDERLKRLMNRAFDVSTWDELLSDL